MVVCLGYYLNHKLRDGIVKELFFVENGDLQVALWKPKRKQKYIQ